MKPAFPRRWPLTIWALAVAWLAAPAVVAQATRIDVAVDRTGNTMRLILTHTEAVSYVMQERDDRIDVVYAVPIFVEPQDRRLDDGILRRFEQRRGNRLVLRTGPDFRGYETFELQNPFRLVIDLYGSSDLAAPPAERERRDPRQRVIVIDPGHGGIETGASGPTGLLEKDVTLDLARRLERLLERDRRITAVLTREEDRLIGLDERTAIANHNRADLFLSIHLNASPRATATGAETYFLSSDSTDDEARTLAALENSAAGAAARGRAAGGADRNLDLVLWDLAQNQYLAESSLLAERVQQHLNELTGTRDRGVRQAPFRVLMGATMPAILVEVGFISNREEEARFTTAGYQERVVDAMTAAVQEFLLNLRRFSAPRHGRSTMDPP